MRSESFKFRTFERCANSFWTETPSRRQVAPLDVSCVKGWTEETTEVPWRISREATGAEPVKGLPTG